MDLLIPDNWLRDYLKTKATPEVLARNLSLCGPSFERIKEGKTGPVHSVEVTTNRIDSASILGIAREASAILPRFDIKAKLELPTIRSKQPLKKRVNYLDAIVDHKLCKRFSAVLVRGVKVEASPKWLQEKLEDSDVRPINNVVDISNYIMLELGQPTHTFDYDKIKNSKMVLRESKEDEELVTLDGKKHKLPGRDIVIEDGSGSLIDLAGIMGGEASAIDENTKNVLLFVQHYDPVRIRKTSMTLAHRTLAASLFEKNLDAEGIEFATRRGIDLLEELTGGKAEKEILDLYPEPYKEKEISLTYEFIVSRLGVEVPKEEVINCLETLGFTVEWAGENLEVAIPSFRANDVDIPEDIVEEVARIYGYHNIPSVLMSGALPEKLEESPFDFERKVKQTLKALGGVEVYTLSLVSKEQIEGEALKLKNPLGKDTEYLRTSLVPSLISALKDNGGVKDPVHLFEVANIYIPREGELPEEKMMLAGVLKNTDYRTAKGILERLLEEVNSKQNVELQSEEDTWYYKIDLAELQSNSSKVKGFKPLPKYPPQVEDLTLVIEPDTKIGEVIEFVLQASENVASVDLVTTYENTITLRVEYQHKEKTLTDAEVAEIRTKLLEDISQKFGVILKS